MNESTIGVVMSVRNGRDFILRTIQSVLDQTWADFHFVIVDDGSSDDTARIIKGVRDPRIQCVVLPRNVGIPTARNLGVDQVSGEFIAVVDADDPVMPQRFEKQKRFLEEHPHIAAIGSQFTAVDEHDRMLFDSRQYEISPVGRVANLFKLLRGSISTLHPCTMYRSAALREFRYDPRFPVGHDYNLGLRLYEAGWETDNLNEYLTTHRDHVASITATRKDRDFEDHHTAFREFFIRLTGDMPNDDELKRYAWAFHFGSLPDGMHPLPNRDILSILRKLVSAYAKRFPGICTPEIEQAVLHRAISREALLLAAYWQQLLQNAAHAGRIALYGAGQHTTWVIEQAKACGVSISVIYDDTPTRSDVSGVPVRATSQLVLDASLTMIVSSDVHNITMAAKMLALVENSCMKVIDPYKALPLGPYLKW